MYDRQVDSRCSSVVEITLSFNVHEVQVVLSNPFQASLPIWGHERIVRINELSQEMQHAPELLAKWRKQLGIRLEPRKKKKLKK